MMTKAERVIFRISALRDPGLKLSVAGRRADQQAAPPPADYVYESHAMRKLGTVRKA